MYILVGSEPDGGVEKGLHRICGKAQTGNAAFGAQMMREHIDDLELEVLTFTNSQSDTGTAKELNKAMVKLYDPEWNRPHIKRLEKMRSAKRARG